MKELAKKDQNIKLLLVGPDELNGKYQEKAKKYSILFRRNRLKNYATNRSSHQRFERSKNGARYVT